MNSLVGEGGVAGAGARTGVIKFVYSSISRFKASGGSLAWNCMRICTSSGSRLSPWRPWPPMVTLKLAERFPSAGVRARRASVFWTRTDRSTCIRSSANPLGETSAKKGHAHQVLPIHGHLDHLRGHRCAQLLVIAVEKTIEQFNVLLRDHAVGGARSFLQAASDFAQVNGGHGGGALVHGVDSLGQVGPLKNLQGDRSRHAVSASTVVMPLGDCALPEPQMADSKGAPAAWHPLQERAWWRPP